MEGFSLERLFRQDGRMREMDKEVFITALQQIGRPLVYVVDELTIDIIPADAKEEYDFWDLVANILFATEEEEEKEQTRVIQDLKDIGIQEG